MSRVPNLFRREVFGVGQVGVLGWNDRAAPESLLVAHRTPGVLGIKDLYSPANPAKSPVTTPPHSEIGRRSQELLRVLQSPVTPALPLRCDLSYLPIALKNPPGLAEADYERAAEDLKCEVAAIKAVTEVESPGSGFLADGRPKILFEAHKFRKFTLGVWDSDYPTVSAVYPESRKRYQGGAAEYLRLELAYPLNPEAALKACSWGKFQILGENHTVAGFDTPRAMVEAMYVSEGWHLKAFVSFVKGRGLAEALRKQDWATFARVYNGADFGRNGYDERLARAYVRLQPAQVPAPSTNSRPGVAKPPALPISKSRG